MIIKIVFYLIVVFLVAFIAFVLYQRLPMLMYPILAKITGEDVQDELSSVRKELADLKSAQETKDALIHELDLSAQAHGYPEITRSVDRFRSENPSDTLQRRY